jgi:hypothetical protein
MLLLLRQNQIGTITTKILSIISKKNEIFEAVDQYSPRWIKA